MNAEMKYKIGQKLYEVLVHDSGKCAMTMHKVRTIRANCVYAIEVIDGITWIKKSCKNRDWGWADNIDPAWRSKCREGENFPYLCTTELSAWYAAKKSHMNWLKRMKMVNEEGDDFEKDYVRDQEKALRTINRMISREKARRKKNCV